MRQIVDDKEFFKAWYDTPFGAPKNPRSKEEAMRVPGCAVKSRERRQEGGGLWPRFYGRVVSYSDERVVVRSVNDSTDGGLRCVWEGTAAEYARMWECD